jgi:hypothetical protein
MSHFSMMLRQWMHVFIGVINSSCLHCITKRCIRQFISVSICQFLIRRYLSPSQVNAAASRQSKCSNTWYWCLSCHAAIPRWHCQLCQSTLSIVTLHIAGVSINAVRSLLDVVVKAANLRLTAIDYHHLHGMTLEMSNRVGQYRANCSL